MARWGRALRLLPPGATRVLDCGCAFGFLTRRLARRHPEVAGIDLDPGYVARARHAVPAADIRLGPVSRLPWPDGHFDAAVCLDVLEHCPDPEAAAAELARVLRPGATLVASVPHAGWLGGADSLNLYARLRPRADPPTDDPSWELRPHHRHFTAAELRAVLGPAFEIDTVRTTGLGVAELLNLPLLLATRGISRRLRPLYAVLQYAYFGLYVLEDLLPMGLVGYHLTVRARRRGDGDAASWRDMRGSA
ncbi:MAG TPA: class I SAM-dependent methyltransferase [Candidatus Dormibacteraeota bacterium]|nr:class I SAM-dependent methyltransferase [Candidatus Dormibacteraeota bacterium]